MVAGGVPRMSLVCLSRAYFTTCSLFSREAHTTLDVLLYFWAALCCGWPLRRVSGNVTGSVLCCADDDGLVPEQEPELSLIHI